MHKSGVILVWFVAIATVGAVLLTSKMLDVRGSWLKVVEKNKAQIQKNTAEIDARERERKKLLNKLTQVMLGWDRYWDVEVSVKDRQSGEIQVKLNGAQPLGGEGLSATAAASQVFYAFQPSDAGKPGGSTYVGAFRFAPNSRDALVLINPPQPGEVATWKNGPWRLRELVPLNYTNTLRSLRDQLVQSEEQNKLKQDHLQDLNRLLAAAKERLEARVSELIGSDTAPQDELLPVELRKGLVTGLEEEEQKRNQEFVETDQLRRELIKVYQKQLELIDEVSKLSNQLPKPKS
ncbi:hypothetical protein [Gimesia algae]|uniref:Uncharacterized protein n=1 Tax=Gimesia algae TaxID=2527971 RepID=A0A517V8K7_9PLAN|nr:hypothetical protein [Gimesia algae]QDT89345.1 hypothetical protein Pan161_09740 [Gimesia algae]